MSDFIRATRARSRSCSRWRDASSARPADGRLRAVHVDLLGALGDLREDGHPVGQHLGEAERDREIELLGPLPVPQQPDLQHRQQRRVARQHAEIALDPGDQDLVHLVSGRSPGRA